MNLLANVNIKTKVFLVTATGILGFIAYFSYVMITGISAQGRLDTMQNVNFPALELANKNLAIEERIKELLANAVSTGEADPLDQAKSSAASIESNLSDLKRLLPEKSTQLNKLQTQLSSYTQVAFELTEGMLGGTLDFSKIGEMANKKNTINDQFLEGLTSFRTATYNEFVQNSDDVNSALSNNVRTGVIIGLITVVIMIAASWAVAGFIDLTIKSITKSLREIAQGDGDLTKRIERKSNDELGELVHWFNVFVEKLHKTISDVVGVIENLSTVSHQLNSVTELTKRVSGDQSSSSAQVSAAMTEMLKAVDYVTSNASSAAEAATDADAEAKEGLTIVSGTVKSINELAGEVKHAAEVIVKLESDTENVGSILSVIQSIAEQTNLLALNAAIEAARAGDQGRGFAVVADEVRTLASRTQEATHEIQSVIEQLQAAARSAAEVMNHGTSKASHSVEQADNTGKSLAQITDKVTLITKMNKEIAGATEAQQQQAETIKSNVQRMTDTSEEAQKGTEQVATLSSDLQDLANQLTVNTSQFKVS